jgi:hypothetical protein
MLPKIVVVGGVGDGFAVGFAAASAPSTFIDIARTEVPKFKYGRPVCRPIIDALFIRGGVVSQEYCSAGKNFPTLTKVLELAGTCISPVREEIE